MAYKVEIINNETGEKRIASINLDWDDGTGSLFWWQEGNMSCDCNRELEWRRAAGEDPDLDSVSCGSTRFSATKVVLEDGREIQIDGADQNHSAR